MKKEIQNNTPWVKYGMYAAIGISVAFAIWYLYRAITLLT